MKIKVRRNLAYSSIFLALFFTLSEANAEHKLADILFPSDNRISETKFTPLTASALKEIQNSLELPSEPCLDHVKMRIKYNSIHEWLSSFKKYDFSGDGIDDLIFISYCGGEEPRNYFWVRSGNKYHYSGLMVGQLSKLFHTQNSKALSAVTRSGWCCASYVGAINLYAPEIQDGILKYVLRRRIMEFSGLKVPDKRTINKRFIVKNDKYRLRYSPDINDEYDQDSSDLEGKPVYGNTIAEFKIGSSGAAIAERPDGTGRVWWFVVMDEDAQAGLNRFYDDTNASKAGWMSSRFLELVN